MNVPRHACVWYYKNLRGFFPLKPTWWAYALALLLAAHDAPIVRFYWPAIGKRFEWSRDDCFDLAGKATFT